MVTEESATLITYLYVEQNIFITGTAIVVPFHFCYF